MAATPWERPKALAIASTGFAILRVGLVSPQKVKPFCVLFVRLRSFAAAIAAPDSDPNSWPLYLIPSSTTVHWQRIRPCRSSFLMTVPTGGRRDSGAAAWLASSALGAACAAVPRAFVLLVWPFFETVFLVCFFDMVIPSDARGLTPGSVRGALDGARPRIVGVARGG